MALLGPPSTTLWNLPSRLQVRHVNRDGKLDLVVANECGADPACRLGTVQFCWATATELSNHS